MQAPAPGVQETAWEIYNRRAAAVDKEMIKHWNDSLNTLLIFVSGLCYSHCILKQMYLGGLVFCHFDCVYHGKHETYAGRYE